MKLIIDAATFYMVHFRFTPYQLPHRDKMGAPATTVAARVCYCTVHEGACKNNTRPCDTPRAVTSWSTCSRLDNFVRYKGRKIAFGRAISLLPKHTRTLLWSAFHKASPPMRKNVIVKGARYVGAVPRSQTSTHEVVCEGVLEVPSGVAITSGSANMPTSHEPLSQADGES